MNTKTKLITIISIINMLRANSTSFFRKSFKTSIFTLLFLLSAGVLIADPPPTISVTGGLELHIDCLFTVDGDVKGSDGKIYVKDGKELRLTGNWINDAGTDFLENTENTITFNSDNSRQSIGGSEQTSFYNVTIDAESYGIDLNQDISISNQLTMTAGNLALQNFQIDLGSSGEIDGESEDTPIKVSDPENHTGTIRRTADISNTAEFTNPGNIGVAIKPTAALGNVSIIRGHKAQQGTGEQTDNYGIARYFEISPDNNDIETEITFYFWDDELETPLTTHLKAELIPYRYVGDEWVPLTEAINAAEDNHITFTTPGFSKFTLGSETYPLPVEFLYFTAEWSSDDYSSVQLDWETASEINSDYYIIQRSDDNMNTWKDIDIVNAAGFSSENILYTEFDNNPPDIGSKSFIYYRLKQVDFDNTYDYSEIAALSGQDTKAVTKLYPNPAENELFLEIISDADFNAIINIYDNKGRKLINKKYPVKTGHNEMQINISNLMPAAYILRIQCEKETYQKQIEFIKQ